MIDAIDRLLGGEIGVDEFRTDFYDYYVDVVPDSALGELGGVNRKARAAASV